ncbi:putative pentatricopeptide repeat-containing protein At3g15200 isoform X1 [Primulina huaijiensis]|uniref:putative pentatricopeptide repeat-containing protein At3g15200 isoform X1 n=2 Tax=Primulina huaijiensis TaxID=1492673 RepID=UPI003CC78F19
MNFSFRRLAKLSGHLHCLLKRPHAVHAVYKPFISPKFLFSSVLVQHYHQINSCDFMTDHKPTISSQQDPCGNSTNDEALRFQTVLKLHSYKSLEEVEQCLNQCCVSLSKDLVLNVLRRYRSEWRPAHIFFKWVCKVRNSSGFFPDTCIYNEILDILGRMKQFDEFFQVFDEMSMGRHLIDQRTFAITVSRLSGAHKVDEAIGFFHKIEGFGLERDLVAFQTLLLSLCRHKHVEEAEVLFRNKKSEFRDDIKTWNIILNGWCVLGSFRDAKRFWKDILASNSKPDKFTYGNFINSLSKSGKISTAKKLLQTMWEKDCAPDAAICNCVMDGLCFKKRVPEALQIFSEMSLKGCTPNASTYNTLIKHLCKIQRMEKVHELLNEMEAMGESCLPNALTYNYLISSAKTPEEVDKILEMMEKNGCKLLADTYNLILRLFMKWGNEARAKKIWDEMENSGTGPDNRSYTIMIHGLYYNGRIRNALKYFNEMMLKGMVPEPRTKLLVDDINFKLKEIDKTRADGVKEWQGTCNAY